MKLIFRMVLIVALSTSCDPAGDETKRDLIDSTSTYPRKIAYCRVASETALETSVWSDDYLWVIQDSDSKVSLVAIVRAENSGSGSTRFVIRELAFRMAGDQISTTVTSETYGFSPDTGALSLKIDEVIMSVDLGAETGFLTKIKGLEYFNRLVCKAFDGLMPYAIEKN
jgi:hypothetical protein